MTLLYDIATSLLPAMSYPSERKLELSVCYARISGSHAAGNDTPNCPHRSLDSQQLNSFIV